jgi:hypothetical protein
LCPYNSYMAQTEAGARKTSAKKIGISLDEYEKKIGLGYKYCYRCSRWLLTKEFGKDPVRHDGLAAYCFKCRKVIYRKTYKPRPRPAKGRRFVLPREGDRNQAVHRINYLVDAGLLDDPNNVPCIDCGHVHVKGGRKHEYDHHLGYESKNHEVVEVTCSRCHHIRHIKRRKLNANKNSLDR